MLYGVMPIPAPATAESLKGVPLAATTIKGELTTPQEPSTPTTVVQQWTERDADHRAHRLRCRPARIARTAERAARVRRHSGSPAGGGRERYDMDFGDESRRCAGRGDRLPFRAAVHGGSVDVFTLPIQMKKNRPAVLLTVLAPADAIGRS